MVPCPIDCVMTDFSDWSDCSATCWEGIDAYIKQNMHMQYTENFRHAKIGNL